MVTSRIPNRATRLARRRRAALLACLSLLPGCTGWPSPPSDSGLPPSQAGGYCRGSGRISEDLAAPAGVRVVISPAKDKLNRTILLNVALLLPPGVAVKLARTEVVLRSPEWPVPRSLPIHHISASGARQYPPTASLTGAAAQTYTSYTLWYSAERQTSEPQTGVPHAEAFSVILPPLEIGAETWQAPEIEFRSYVDRTWFGCRS
jgi:hypothetical protein